MRKKHMRGLYQLIMNYNIIFCFLIVMCRIPLGRVLDDQGMGYLAVPMELYLIAVYAFAMPLAKTISGLMKVRIKREQYRNAVRIAGCGHMLSILPAAVLAALFALSCKNLGAAFQADLSWMALAAAAVPVFFVIISSAPKGFLMGIASKTVVLIGQIIETVFCIGGLIAGARMGTGYGAKAAALLKNENMVYGYGAYGAMAGLALSSVIVWVLWQIFYFVFRRMISAEVRADSGKRTEDVRTCVGSIFYNAAPVMAAALMTQGMLLLLMWIYMHHPGTDDGLEKAIAYWGCYYGKYLPIMMIPIVIGAYYMTLHNSRITAAYEKDDARQLRDRIEKGLVKLNAISFSGAIFAVVLGQVFMETFYTGMTVSVLKIVNMTSVLVICYCYFYTAHNLLFKLQYHSEGIIMLAVSFSIGAVASYIVLVKMHKGLMGAALCLILFYLTGAVIGSVRLYFITHCEVNLIRCFALPILAPAISGAAVMFLIRLLQGTAGAAITLLVGAFLGIFIDILLLMAFRVVTENQVRNIPGGFIIVQIGRGIGLF